MVDSLVQFLYIKFHVVLIYLGSGFFIKLCSTPSTTYVALSFGMNCVFVLCFESNNNFRISYETIMLVVIFFFLKKGESN